jgi:intein-like protein with splicing domain/HNH endonuclease
MTKLSPAEAQKRRLALMNKINKEAKHTVITTADKAHNPYFLRRPSGIMQLDIDTGGGLPAGGLSYLTGPDNCLSGSTLIHHEVRDEEGERCTHKWITIERLYERFHRLIAPGKGKGRTVERPRRFYAPSMNDERGIVQNQILDVVSTGEQECFELITKTGHRIEATAKHRFFNGTTYVTLQTLREGDSVFVHINTRRQKDPAHKSAPGQRDFLYVKTHPTAYRKKIHDKKTGNTYFYHVLPKARAVVEATMNQLTLESFVDRLNNGKVDDLEFLSRDQIVHHRDENTQNDDLENLLVVTRADHMREHLKDSKRDNDFRFVATEEVITSIRSVGIKKTYDLKMCAPFHNYVANSFVVHNSGKTFLLYKYFAMQQRIYGPDTRLAFAPTEGPPDYFFMRKCGINIAIPDAIIEQKNELQLERGLPKFTKEEIKSLKTQTGVFDVIGASTAEELLDTALMLIDSKLYSILAIDSISAIIPASEAALETLEKFGQQAAAATALTRFLMHYYPMTNNLDEMNTTTVVFTGQVRQNRKKAEAASFMAKYMHDWAPTGAFSARHGKLLDITVWPGGRIKKSPSDTVAIGKQLKWKLSKGKAGTHDGIEGEIDFLYDTLTDDIASIIAAGFRHGCFIEKSGLITMVRPETREPSPVINNIPGVESLKKMLVEDVQLEWSVRREVLAAAKLQCTYW